MTHALDTGHLVFPTELGHCGISWTSRGIERFLLPHKSKRKALAALKSIYPNYKITTQPRPLIRKIARRISGHFEGNFDDFRDIALDLQNASAFFQKVAAALRQVDAGCVVTYKKLASRAGSPKAARAVGRCMAQNPLPLLIPCHRVIASNGGLGGFSAPDGIELKARILALEGIEILNQKIPRLA